MKKPSRSDFQHKIRTPIERPDGRLVVFDLYFVAFLMCRGSVLIGAELSGRWIGYVVQPAESFRSDLHAWNCESTMIRLTDFLDAVAQAKHVFGAVKRIRTTGSMMIP